ncbi:MAG: TonB-dependent receptor [Colwellia sp.]|nr:TonB-dependent receptor [Colwellia sp.]
MANGSSDMATLLRTVTPSYNVSAQAISDGATIVRPANLRGLSPDSTLILVNGKRRHKGSIISFSGGGIADGAQSPDVSTIPAIALKQIEVLRDGASAQYGSDAVAGVINFVLKDSDSGGQFELKMGQFSEGDGDQVTVSGNVGLGFSDNGFVNFSFEINQQDPTSRSTQRSDAQGLIDAGNTAVADPAQVWGSPEISDDFKLFLNTGIELANGGDAYMFGNWSEKTVEGGFFFRNPTNKGGVFNGPTLDDEFYSDDITNVDTILVGDLTPGAVDNSACPIVRLSQDGIPDATALASLEAANCYAHNLRFPGGFTPFFGGEVVDLSLVMGTRGEFSDGTTYDFSGSVGEHSTEFHMSNTINSSMGPNTPTVFTPGAYAQLEKSLNADFSKEFESIMGLEFLVVSYGVEVRQETFTITAGDEASWKLGPLVSQGFSIGSNGFPGFKPADAGASSRTSKAAYLDMEADLTEDFLAQVAFRAEDFSDFGSNFSWKVAGMYDINEAFKIRASVSTGFRAPTIGQSSVRSVQTQMNIEKNELEDIATLPPTNPVSARFGGVALTPEEAISYAMGMVYQQDEFFLTVDYFNIEVTDRITQTSKIDLTDQDRQELSDLGVTDAIGLSSVKFFTNDFDTTTQGIDIVANYANEMFSGDMKYSLAYNWTETTVDKFGPNVNERKINRLEKSLPEHKGSFTVNYLVDSWSFMARANYYGEWNQYGPDIKGDAAILLDTEFAYSFDNGAGFAVGINNLTDDNGPVAEGAPAGRSYASTSPYGFNGRFVYAKATYSF